MQEEKIVDIIAEALLNSDKVNYIVRMSNGKGLQVETKENRHYNIIIRDLEFFGGLLIALRQNKKAVKKPLLFLKLGTL